MVLELKPPHGSDWSALARLGPNFLGYVLSFVNFLGYVLSFVNFLGYVLSFVYVAIYWNNHHHLLHAAHRVDGLIGPIWRHSSAGKAERQCSE
jgi:uncharacterized membrane protein